MNDRYCDWKRWPAELFGTYTDEESWYFAAELRAAGISDLRGLAVGELGFGNGNFAGWVARAGGHWLGREANDELNARAVKAGFGIVPAGESFVSCAGPASVDLIVAFDVVEHLDVGEIRRFLLDCHGALRQGGTLLLRVPSGDSPFVGAVHCGDLTHKTLLGSGAVRQLALEACLTLVTLRAPRQPLRGLAPLRVVRRLIARMVQRIAYRLIGTVLMANNSAVLSPNMIVVLRKTQEPGESASS